MDSSSFSNNFKYLHTLFKSGVNMNKKESFLYERNLGKKK